MRSMNYTIRIPTSTPSLVYLSLSFSLRHTAQTPCSLTEDDSPYPEVRSAVANFDDPDMPASTLRAWIIGLILAVIIAGMNQFFYLRFPSVSVGGVSRSLLSKLFS